MLTPKKIVNTLDLAVQGQDEAKKALAVIGFMHHTAFVESELLEAEFDDTHTAKTNILLLGPSGCGKTYLVKKLSEIMRLPFYQISAANLTNEGYVGSSLNDHLVNYFGTTRREGTYTQNEINHGIIFVDELDKLEATDSSSSLNGWLKQVQTSLLRACEGFPVYKDERSEGAKTCGHTKDLLFIFAGNFASIRKRREERKVKNIGFMHQTHVETMTLEKEITDSGIMPELIGRMGYVTELNPLTKDDLREIILNKEGSVIKQYQRLFKFLQRDLTLGEEEIELLIQKAQDSPTGARALKREALGMLLDTIYNIGDEDDGLNNTE